MPLGLFRSSTFSGGNLLTLFVYAALGSAMFFLPLNLVQIQGYNQLTAGLALLPMIILIAGISLFIGRYTDRTGVRLPLIMGPIITSIGFFLFSTYGITAAPGAYWNTFFISILLLGVGMGITVAPLTTAVMGAISEENVGIASGINNTVARAAGVLAVALMGAWVLFSYKNTIERELSVMDIPDSIKNEITIESSNLAAAAVPNGLPLEDNHMVEKLYRISFISAFNKVVYVASILCLMGGIMAFVFIRPRRLE
jgi:MFS family permease